MTGGSETKPDKNTQTETPENRKKILQHYRWLILQVDMQGILDTLIENGLVTFEERMLIPKERTTTTTILKLLEILQQNPKNYQIFLKSLEKIGHIDIALQVKNTDINKPLTSKGYNGDILLEELYYDHTPLKEIESEIAEENNTMFYRIEAFAGKIELRKLNVETQPFTDAQNLIVLGKTGTGKSSLCNTIVGAPTFVCDLSLQSVTTEIRSVMTDRFRRKINVIDTPGVDSFEFGKENLRSEILNKTCGENNVFALVISMLEGFTREEIEAINMIRHVFGESFDSRCIVLFTGADDLKARGLSFKDYKKTAPSHLAEILGKYPCMEIDNTVRDDLQDKRLMALLDTIAKQHRIGRNAVQSQIRDPPNFLDKSTFVNPYTVIPYASSLISDIGRDDSEDRLDNYSESVDKTNCIGMRVEIDAYEISTMELEEEVEPIGRVGVMLVITQDVIFIPPAVSSGTIYHESANITFIA